MTRMWLWYCASVELEPTSKASLARPYVGAAWTAWPSIASPVTLSPAATGVAATLTVPSR
ncbi:hypothetical protein MF672_037650 [Actinomadura sp. ATCC 31491]|uniref:Uncharacterized protein n=1 Tax=Actinomadura luzonensis TaxID=2805427 RepID=A0ABT0G5X4_9ACTN|nr:hypothetical protein [Actinomadura luzonensis]MCK2219481.1 hypothetical protein [Actinomadura luzonensis]